MSISVTIFVQSLFNHYDFAKAIEEILDVSTFPSSADEWGVAFSWLHGSATVFEVAYQLYEQILALINIIL